MRLKLSRISVKACVLLLIYVVYVSARPSREDRSDEGDSEEDDEDNDDDDEDSSKPFKPLKPLKPLKPFKPLVGQNKPVLPSLVVTSDGTNSSHDQSIKAIIEYLEKFIEKFIKPGLDSSVPGDKLPSWLGKPSKPKDPKKPLPPGLLQSITSILQDMKNNTKPSSTQSPPVEVHSDISTQQSTEVTQSPDTTQTIEALQAEQAIRPEEAQLPSESIQPAEVIQPSEAVQPVEGSQAASSSQHTEPMQPADAATMAEVGQPADVSQLSEVAQPFEALQPVEQPIEQAVEQPVEQPVESPVESVQSFVASSNVEVDPNAASEQIPIYDSALSSPGSEVTTSASDILFNPEPIPAPPIDAQPIFSGQGEEPLAKDPVSFLEPDPQTIPGFSFEQQIQPLGGELTIPVSEGSFFHGESILSDGKAPSDNEQGQGVQTDITSAPSIDSMIVGVVSAGGIPAEPQPFDTLANTWAENVPPNNYPYDYGPGDTPQVGNIPFESAPSETGPTLDSSPGLAQAEVATFDHMYSGGGQVDMKPPEVLLSESFPGEVISPEKPGTDPNYAPELVTADFSDTTSMTNPTEFSAFETATPSGSNIDPFPYDLVPSEFIEPDMTAPPSVGQNVEGSFFQQSYQPYPAYTGQLELPTGSFFTENQALPEQAQPQQEETIPSFINPDSLQAVPPSSSSNIYETLASTHDIPPPGEQPVLMPAVPTAQPLGFQGFTGSTSAESQLSAQALSATISEFQNSQSEQGYESMVTDALALETSPAPDFHQDTIPSAVASVFDPAPHLASDATGVSSIPDAQASVPIIPNEFQSDAAATQNQYELASEISNAQNQMIFDPGALLQSSISGSAAGEQTGESSYLPNTAEAAPESIASVTQTDWDAGIAESYPHDGTQSWQLSPELSPQSLGFAPGISPLAILTASDSAGASQTLSSEVPPPPPAYFPPEPVFTPQVVQSPQYSPTDAASMRVPGEKGTGNISPSLPNVEALPDQGASASPIVSGIQIGGESWSPGELVTMTSSLSTAAPDKAEPIAEGVQSAPVTDFTPQMSSNASQISSEGQTAPQLESVGSNLAALGDANTLPLQAFDNGTATQLSQVEIEPQLPHSSVSAALDTLNPDISSPPVADQALTVSETQTTAGIEPSMITDTVLVSSQPNPEISSVQVDPNISAAAVQATSESLPSLPETAATTTIEKTSDTPISEVVDQAVLPSADVLGQEPMPTTNVLQVPGSLALSHESAPGMETAPGFIASGASSSGYQAPSDSPSPELHQPIAIVTEPANEISPLSGGDILPSSGSKPVVEDSFLQPQLALETPGSYFMGSEAASDATQVMPASVVQTLAGPDTSGVTVSQTTSPEILHDGIGQYSPTPSVAGLDSSISTVQTAAGLSTPGSTIMELVPDPIVSSTPVLSSATSTSNVQTTIGLPASGLSATGLGTNLGISSQPIISPDISSTTTQTMKLPDAGSSVSHLSSDALSTTTPTLTAAGSPSYGPSITESSATLGTSLDGIAPHMPSAPGASDPISSSAIQTAVELQSPELIAESTAAPIFPDGIYPDVLSASVVSLPESSALGTQAATGLSSPGSAVQPSSSGVMDPSMVLAPEASPAISASTGVESSGSPVVESAPLSISPDGMAISSSAIQTATGQISTGLAVESIPDPIFSDGMDPGILLASEASPPVSALATQAASGSVAAPPSSFSDGKLPDVLLTPDVSPSVSVSETQAPIGLPSPGAVIESAAAPIFPDGIDPDVLLAHEAAPEIFVSSPQVETGSQSSGSPAVESALPPIFPSGVDSGVLLPQGVITASTTQAATGLQSSEPSSSAPGPIFPGGIDPAMSVSPGSYDYATQSGSDVNTGSPGAQTGEVIYTPGSYPLTPTVEETEPDMHVFDAFDPHLFSPGVFVTALPAFAIQVATDPPLFTEAPVDGTSHDLSPLSQDPGLFTSPSVNAALPASAIIAGPNVEANKPAAVSPAELTPEMLFPDGIDTEVLSGPYLAPALPASAIQVATPNGSTTAQPVYIQAVGTPSPVLDAAVIDPGALGDPDLFTDTLYPDGLEPLVFDTTQLGTASVVQSNTSPAQITAAPAMKPHNVVQVPTIPSDKIIANKVPPVTTFNEAPRPSEPLATPINIPVGNFQTILDEGALVGPVIGPGGEELFPEPMIIEADAYEPDIAAMVSNDYLKGNMYAPDYHYWQQSPEGVAGNLRKAKTALGDLETATMPTTKNQEKVRVEAAQARLKTDQEVIRPNPVNRIPRRPDIPEIGGSPLVDMIRRTVRSISGYQWKPVQEVVSAIFPGMDNWNAIISGNPVIARKLQTANTVDNTPVISHENFPVEVEQPSVSGSESALSLDPGLVPSDPSRKSTLASNV